MRVLVVGLGSMGKRRVRNLHANGVTEVAGYDVRPDRLEEAVALYGVAAFGGLDEALNEYQPDAIVISTGPRHHMDVAFKALDLGIPAFIEASVTDAARILELDIRARAAGVLMAPSCTMRFFPGPKIVKDLIVRGVIGRPLAFNYQTGQWLPDWHPWEHIQEFYVSDRETGGCREIVPFELTWLNDVFGDARPIACSKRKASYMDAEIDDVYQCLFGYPGGLVGTITVEVLSRPNSCRDLRVTGSEGSIVLSADEGTVRYCNLEDPTWTVITLDAGTVESGYINPEEPYREEISRFLQAATSGDHSIFPNNLVDDAAILQVLVELEELGA